MLNVFFLLLFLITLAEDEEIELALAKICGGIVHSHPYHSRLYWWRMDPYFTSSNRFFVNSTI